MMEARYQKFRRMGVFQVEPSANGLAEGTA